MFKSNVQARELAASTGLTSRMVRKKLGKIYNVKKDEHCNLNLDNKVELKTTDSKLKVEEMGTTKKLTVSIKHDYAELSDIHGVTLDA